MKKLLILAMLALSFTAQADSTQSAISVRKLFSTGVVTAGTWVPLVSAMVRSASFVSLNNKSNIALLLGTAPQGATADAEVQRLVIPSGGNVPGILNVPMYIPAGYRVSIKVANSVAVATEELDMSLIYTY